MDTVEVLTKEYLQIMEVIKNYDNISMVIKGWSITLGTGFIGYSFKYNSRQILLVCCLSALCFMLVDAKYKEYQTNYYPRMVEIENCIQVESEKGTSKHYAYSNCKPLNVDTSWFDNKKWYGFFNQFRKFNVYLPHIFILLISMVLFYIWKPTEIRSE